MLAVIDCGTTNTRVYVLDRGRSVIGVGERHVGVRDTSMTGSKDALRQGLCLAIGQAVENAGVTLADIRMAIASGMITSEIGLIELPHLVAPVGLEELSENVYLAKPFEVLPLDLPVLFIRGVRNNYGEAVLQNIRHVDFMRGEEVQVMGILDEYDIHEPTNIVVLSSHTKIIHTSAQRKIEACMTTISGQLYEAICKQTNVGKSLEVVSEETSGGYSFEEVVRVATEVTNDMGLDRCLLIPRFMQVLLQTDYKERNLFIDTAIAVDDMKIFSEFEEQGYLSDSYVLFGHKVRCELYANLLRKKYGDNIRITQVYDKSRLADLTVQGALVVAERYMRQHNFVKKTKEM